MRWGLEVRRVARIRDDGQPRPGDARSDRLGAGATAPIQPAGDDQRRGADLRQAVVEGLHGPLPRPPQARRESGRPVAEALGAQTGGAAGWQRGMAGEDRFALPFVDEGTDPVALSKLTADLTAGASALSAAVIQNTPAA